MNPVLVDIQSIINGYSNAKDKDRVFTYIEFVKMFGYDNDTNIFISAYKDYVTQWTSVKKDSITLSDEDFVMSKMVEVLKSITLDYSSYEEQDFIAHIDLNNKDHLKGLTALYSRKIREITEFYRKKRNEAVLVVNRNSMKGSVKSIQEIIYEKVFDFIFSNRNIVPSYKNIKRDLLISIENYVDTYSEYFDIPRQKEFTDKSRAEMLSANMNDVDYRVYIEIQLVISEILFSGNVFLEEIPLIAQIGADLSQSCVGDMLALKNQLMANTTVNQVDLDEQVALKRKLYEKFLGCDLWYMYVDLQGNVQTDVLCYAKNPSGNLLNCGTADTATVENEQLELLSHIGLFFKPDKTSILKVNAKSYTWSIDTDVIENDTVYVFPDPNRYGDIGNNKSSTYPLLMEYKVDHDVKNISSGEAVNDPIKMLSDQGWYSYYSKQDDDFKLFDNKDYDYAFTWLANKGFVANYQVDAYGNQFGILKGCEVKYNYDDKGNKISVKSIKLNPKYNETVIKNTTADISDSAPKILNGGYMENPFYKGEEMSIKSYKWRDNAQTVPFKVVFDTNLNTWRRAKGEEIEEATTWCRVVRDDVSFEEVKKVEGVKSSDDQYVNYVKYTDYQYKWVNSGSEENAVPFDFNKQLTLIDDEDDRYEWSGLKIKNDALYYSDIDTNFVSFGDFGGHTGYIYKDHFEKKFSEYDNLEKEDSIVTDVILEFLTHNMYESDEIEIIEDNKTFYDLAEEGGTFYVKPCGKLGTKPVLFTDAFDWLSFGEDEIVKNFSIIYKTIVIETNTRYLFVPYDYDGENFVNTIGIREMYSIDKFKKIRKNNKITKENFLQTSLLFNEVTKSFYVIEVEEVTVDSSGNEKHHKFRKFLVPRIYKFDCEKYKMEEVVNLYDSVCREECIKQQIDKIIRFDNRVIEKEQIALAMIDKFKALLDKADESELYYNLGNFEVPFYNIDLKTDLKKVAFTYNSNLCTYLLSFMILDNNATPYIHEHKFKLDDLDTFNSSLVSNVYTLKGDGDSYKWNDKVNATAVSTIPYNEKSVLDNGIWEQYAGTGVSNKGFDLFGNNIFDVNFGNEDYGSNTTTAVKTWTSKVYEGSAYEYRYNSTRKVTGKVNFDKTCVIKKQGINVFNISYTNLTLTKKVGDKINSITMTQVLETNKFDVRCDMFGNISGNSTVKIKSTNITDDKRRVEGVARLNISGTVDNYSISVIITVWDIIKNDITVIEPGGGDVVIENGDWILNKDNWMFKLSSDVYLYDSVDGINGKTYDSEKKLRIDPTQLKIKVNGSNDGTAQLGFNTINLSFDSMYIIKYDSASDKDTGGKMQYIIQNDGKGIDFNLEIKDNGKQGVISFPGWSNYVQKNISVNDVLVESSGSLTMGKNNYSITTASGTTRKLNSKYDGDKLFIDLHATINYQSCKYDCWVKYDAWNCPVEYSLARMGNFSNFFGDSDNGERIWNFTSYDENGYAVPVEMPSCTSFGNSFLAARVGRVQIDNTNNGSLSSFTPCNYRLYDLKFIDSIGGKPLSKTVISKFAFCRTHHGIDYTRDYCKRSMTDSNYTITDPRYYPIWYEMIKYADLNMQKASEKGKALVDKFNAEVIPTTTNTFKYEMTDLRNANLMFLQWEVWGQDFQSSDKWPDDQTPKIGRLDRYYDEYNPTVSERFKLNETRRYDFDEIELKTPNLRSGVGMFYNYPLKVSEAKIFADSLPDLTIPHANENDIKTISYTSKVDNKEKTVTFGGKSMIEEIEWFINDFRYDNRGTQDKDDRNIIDYVYTKYYNEIEKPNSEEKLNAQEKDIMLGRYYLGNFADAKIRERVNGINTWCYPSITLFFDLKDGYNVNEAKSIIDTIANKGWEVATNIAYASNKKLNGRGSEVASGSNYIIRATEIGGLSGLVFMSAQERRTSHASRQDFNLEICKGVSNVITCNDRMKWIRVCQLWKYSADITINLSWKNDRGIAYVLGASPSNYGTSLLMEKNKDGNFDKDGTMYCSSTWAKTTIEDFIGTKYNLKTL